MKNTGKNNKINKQVTTKNKSEKKKQKQTSRTKKQNYKQ